MRPWITRKPPRIYSKSPGSPLLSRRPRAGRVNRCAGPDGKARRWRQCWLDWRWPVAGIFTGSRNPHRRRLPSSLPRPPPRPPLTPPPPSGAPKPTSYSLRPASVSRLARWKTAAFCSNRPCNWRLTMPSCWRCAKRLISNSKRPGFSGRRKNNGYRRNCRLNNFWSRRSAPGRKGRWIPA